MHTAAHHVFSVDRSTTLDQIEELADFHRVDPVVILRQALSR